MVVCHWALHERAVKPSSFKLKLSAAVLNLHRAQQVPVPAVQAWEVGCCCSLPSRGDVDTKQTEEIRPATTGVCIAFVPCWKPTVALAVTGYCEQPRAAATG
jgi:hypothetical protein